MFPYLFFFSAYSWNQRERKVTPPPQKKKKNNNKKPCNNCIQGPLNRQSCVLPVDCCTGRLELQMKLRVIRIIWSKGRQPTFWKQQQQQQNKTKQNKTQQQQTKTVDYSNYKWCWSLMFQRCFVQRNMTCEKPIDKTYETHLYTRLITHYENEIYRRFMYDLPQPTFKTLIFEPRHEKTCPRVCDQIRHKPACSVSCRD